MRFMIWESCFRKMTLEVGRGLIKEVRLQTGEIEVRNLSNTPKNQTRNENLKY